jgi:predicted PurR-regulated permease PerM
MDRPIQLPVYVKIALILLSLVIIIYTLNLAQGIIVPIVLAFLFAILLSPIANFFKTKLHLPNVISVIITVLLFVIFVAGLVTFISFQVTGIASDINKIEKNIDTHIRHIQQFVKEEFHVSKREQNQYVQETITDSVEKGKAILGTTLMSFTDTLLNLILFPIYLFLALLYRNHFMTFLIKLFEKEGSKLHDIIINIKVAIKSYIVGLIIETIAVSVLTSIGFMIIGIEYAILLGVITGILNLIPYIGIMFAGILSMIASLSTSTDISIVFGVFIVIAVVQLIDNNILVPMIVSSKVQINALVSIVGIIIGGAIAGISGMFLAIPLIAIVKVIFDRIDSLEPWGYLLGDDIPKTYQWGKIRLPHYNYGSGYSNSHSHINEEITAIVYTEVKDKEDPTPDQSPDDK